MSSLFIKRDDKVAVSIDGGVNTIWVRRQMGLALANRVQDTLMSSTLDAAGRPQNLNYNVGLMNTILMQNNIVAWEGPLFRDEDNNPLPCTPQMIEDLDPNSDLVEAVLTEINDRNKKVATDPKLSSANGKNGLTPITAQKKQVASRPA